MNLVIDIQGLNDRHNNFSPKEVAVVALHTSYLGHWIITPPHTYNTLPSDVKKINSWIQRNCHGIAWSEGHTSLRNIECTLRKICSRASRIFTRGSDKAAYLSRLTGYFIINMEDDVEDSSFRRLPGNGILCIYHGIQQKKNPKYKCALHNATRLKTWLSQTERIDSLWEYRTTTALNIELPSCEEGRKKIDNVSASYEQSSNSALLAGYQKSHSRRLPSGSYTEGVDETDSICS